MSLFQSSAETAKETTDKVLIYGPTHTSKTHAGLGWPDPAEIDVENRAGHFADRFKFMHARPRTMADVIAVLEEIKAGKVPCKSIVFDSYGATYEKLVVTHTETTTNQQTGKVTAVTDYATVNKRIAPVREFVFSTSDKNVIVITHSTMKYGRNGNTFSQKGVDIVGDAKFRYAFDYIFRTEATGPDPRTHAVKFHVEKSASPNIKVGDVIVVKPGERLYDLLEARKKGSQKAEPVRELHDDGTPIATEQIDRIEVLTHKLRWSQMQLADAVKRISQKRNPQYRSMTHAEAARLIAVMEERAKGA